MLKLFVKNLDICRVSKIIAKYQIKASITKTTIVLDNDELTSKMIEELLENVVIIRAQNYQTSCDEASQNDVDVKEDTRVCDTYTQLEVESSAETIEKDQEKELEVFQKNDEKVLTKRKKRHKKIKREISQNRVLERGEVYSWDIYTNSSEDEYQKVRECVIILQNNYPVSDFDNTIALFCTSSIYSKNIAIDYTLYLNEKNLIDCNKAKVNEFRAPMFIKELRGVKREELGEYLGTINNYFLNALQPQIDYCLGLKRYRTVNFAQLKMLSMVNMQELFQISKSNKKNSEKITEFLELFGFDLNKNGMKYVQKAILYTQDMIEYNLDALAIRIAEKEHVEPAEVLRLIVARIKEHFKFKKSPAISFIRLIDSLMKKG